MEHGELANMKNRKGFIQVPIVIWIVTSILVLGGAGYFGVKQYQNYLIEKVEKEKLAEVNKKADENQRQKLQGLLDSQSKELEKQKGEIETLKKKPSVVIQQNVEKTPTPSAPQNPIASLADLIEDWSPNIAKINCLADFNKVEGGPEKKASLTKIGVDTRPVAVSGSGFLISVTSQQYGAGTIAIVTNRHVLNTHNGFGIAYYCEATLPGGHKYTFDVDDILYVTGQEEFGYEDKMEYFDGEPYMTYKIDAALLRMKNPDIYATNLARTKSLLTCAETPRIGEDVVILGYPSIGSSESITATDGIISGLEEFYFITSAKVEHGNSGGAAILRSKNCYLGIPTFARTGVVESLARILSFKKIFK